MISLTVYYKVLFSDRASEGKTSELNTLYEVYVAFTSVIVAWSTNHITSFQLKQIQ